MTNGVLAENTIVEMAESGTGDHHVDLLLAHGEGPWAVHGVTRLRTWPSHGASLQGAPTRIKEGV